jgi:hypothetical protein
MVVWRRLYQRVLHSMGTLMDDDGDISDDDDNSRR